MPEIPFKQPVPDHRTIVPGVWSDILNNWLVSFDVDGDSTEVRVNLRNLGEISALLALSLSKIHDQQAEIVNELKLLNLRTEEMGNTRITERDIR